VKLIRQEIVAHIAVRDVVPADIFCRPTARNAGTSSEMYLTPVSKKAFEVDPKIEVLIPPRKVEPVILKCNR
jgi:hypothetical protein